MEIFKSFDNILSRFGYLDGDLHILCFLHTRRTHGASEVRMEQFIFLNLHRDHVIVILIDCERRLRKKLKSSFPKSRAQRNHRREEGCSR